MRTQHDGPPRVEGNLLYGAGAADMKSGLAIMIELVERLDLRALPCDLTLIFYEREEGPFEENRLGPILDNYPKLHELDLAICLEPSDNQMQLGAMGSIHATLPSKAARRTARAPGRVTTPSTRRRDSWLSSRSGRRMTSTSTGICFAR